MKIPFTKMQGIGNDFVVIDDFLRGGATPLDGALARRICDRRFGVGADQILWLKPARGAGADLRMEILNSDGSTAEMCGNGIRAVALYVRARAKDPRDHYRIETLAGVKTVQLQGAQVTVDMGVPSVAEDRLEVAGVTLPFTEVGVGNPHAVFFVEDPERPAAGLAAHELGPRIETHPRFPARTNVEFVRVENPGAIRVRVWERGAGITLACGTGACAAAVASLATGRVQGPVTVHLPGGDLRIRWAGPGAPVFMEGPAEEVFTGDFPA